MNLEERSARIEEQIMFLQRHVEELDGVVRSLHDRLARLEESLRAMREDHSELRNRIAQATREDDSDDEK